MAGANRHAEGALPRSDVRGVMVVVDVRVDKSRPEIVLVKQKLAVVNGELVKVGPEQEETVAAFDRPL